jgi:hypothetical protein
VSRAPPLLEFVGGNDPSSFLGGDFGKAADLVLEGNPGIDYNAVVVPVRGAPIISDKDAP